MDMRSEQDVREAGTIADRATLPAPKRLSCRRAFRQAPRQLKRLTMRGHAGSRMQHRSLEGIPGALVIGVPVRAWDLFSTATFPRVARPHRGTSSPCGPLPYPSGGLDDFECNSGINLGIRSD